MAILNKEDFMSHIKTLIGDNDSDETLKIVEDITDTINDYDTKVKGDGTDWKQKYEENDKAWREKYRERFFNGSSNDDDNEGNGGSDNDDHKAPKTFEELFS